MEYVWSTYWVASQTVFSETYEMLAARFISQQFKNVIEDEKYISDKQYGKNILGKSRSAYV